VRPATRGAARIHNEAEVALSEEFCDGASHESPRAEKTRPLAIIPPLTVVARALLMRTLLMHSLLARTPRTWTLGTWTLGTWTLSAQSIPALSLRLAEDHAPRGTI
jgi:hypothetical protein